MATFNLISPGIDEQRNSVLSKFDKFVITLERLRLNLQVKDLAYRYDVTPSVISKAFAEVIDLLYENLKGVILWPAREQLRYLSIFSLHFRYIFPYLVIGCLEHCFYRELWHLFCVPETRFSTASFCFGGQASAEFKPQQYGMQKQ